MAESAEQHVIQVEDKEHKVFIQVYRDVKNTAELRPLLMNGTINAAVVSAKKIVSSFQLVVAANIALHNQGDGTMKTKNINSEIIFSLSPGKQISKAFQQFGAGPDDTAIAAVAVDSADRLLALHQAVDGTAVSAAELAQLVDTAAVRKLYEVGEEELRVGTLEEAVVNRIATRCAT